MRLGILKLGNENKLSFTTGSFCRNNHITAPTKPITAIMAKNIIKLLSNQSSCCPLSKKICKDPKPKAIKLSPI